ncbi:hypothetical protein RRG08_059831 [Elysia crispata]|uniref:Secreted protein n=1 Tax=Elysia crispata TaxID=231223 RepID=A0AAE0ZEL6_9GAST|nr:hypothetical protein RRG08_059831 [Elysia crispata]
MRPLWLVVALSMFPAPPVPAALRLPTSGLLVLRVTFREHFNSNNIVQFGASLVSRPGLTTETCPITKRFQI